MSIHPSSVISPDAKLGSEIEIGPFVVVEEGVTIGDNCKLDAACQIRNGSVLGAGCHIGSGAIIGADPQYLGFDPSIRSGVIMGSENTLREYVTIHRSIHEGENTVMGDRNYLMTGAHLGHDCALGNDNTLANNALLGGHVTFGDFCFAGGGSVFHQYVNVGNYVMIQGLAGFSLDLPHYVIGAGVNYVAGINSIGLRRGGFGPDARKEIKQAFHAVYRSGKPLQEVLDSEDAKAATSPEALAFYDFFRQKSKKGFCIRMEKGA